MGASVSLLACLDLDPSSQCSARRYRHLPPFDTRGVNPNTLNPNFPSSLLTPHPNPSVTGGVIRKTVFYLFVQHLLGIFDCVLGSFRVFSCFLLCSLLFSGMQATTQCGRRRVIRKRFKPRAPSNSLLYKGVPTLIYTSNSLLYNINISHNLGVPLRVEYVHQHIEEQPVQMLVELITALTGQRRRRTLDSMYIMRSSTLLYTLCASCTPCVNRPSCTLCSPPPPTQRPAPCTVCT